MAKEFTRTIRVHLQQRLFDRLAAFSNTSACAGVRGNSEVVRKMATNYYGGANLPRRPWLDAATGDGELMAHYESELLKVLKKLPISSSMPTYSEKGTGRYEGEIQVVGGRLFGKGGYGQQGEYIMRKIADQMAKNQTDIIASGLLEPNAPRTIAKKGFDRPLYETGESFANIQGWVENG